MTLFSGLPQLGTEIRNDGERILSQARDDGWWVYFTFVYSEWWKGFLDITTFAVCHSGQT